NADELPRGDRAAGDPSLRLKNGFAQDDTIQVATKSGALLDTADDQRTPLHTDANGEEQGALRLRGSDRFALRSASLRMTKLESAEDAASDRVLVDVNQLATDGTVALDWFEPSFAGRFVAYGTSASGSEMSTLHVIETKTGTILPDTIERTRAASIA